jgi:O-antigen/teichoic acid export membrane protein
LGGYSRKILTIARFIDGGVTGPDRRRIIRGTFNSFLIQGISVALVFVSNLWVVRSSSPDAYGLYVHVFNWVSILSIIVLGGRDDLVLTRIPKYIAESHPFRLLSLVRAANRWIFLSAILVSGSFLIVISVFSVRTLSENRAVFMIASAAVYLAACLALNQMILQALNHIRLSQLVEKIVKPLLMILVIGLFRLFIPFFDGRALVILSSLVLFICCLVLLGMVKAKIKRYSLIRDERSTDEGLKGKAFYFFCISLLYLLSTKITMLTLPYFAPPKAIGIFNIGYRFADLLVFPFFLMHTVLPQLFARHAVTGRAYTQSLFSESNKLMTLLSLPLLLLNLLAGKFLLHLFGPEFGTGYTAMLYISLAQFLSSFFGPANTILMMQDREKYSAGCLLVYVLVLLAMSWWLIPGGGITGGALAILVSSGVYNILLAVVTYRLFGIYSPFFSWLVPRRV